MVLQQSYKFWNNCLLLFLLSLYLSLKYCLKTINNHSGNKDEQLQFSQKPDMDYKVEQVEDLIFLLHYILQTEILQFVVF